MVSLFDLAIGLLGLLGLMLMGLHVAVVVFIMAGISAVLFFGVGALQASGTVMWGVLNNFILTAIPLFVLLGEILLRAGISEKMYESLSGWLARFPGGLLHTNIAASTVFAAISGSSVATAATIGTVAIPSLRQREYNEKLTLGTIAAGGTLGILIPPSIPMIMYGALTNTSIGALFMAGVIPGLMLAITFSGIIIVACLVRPKNAGIRDEVPSLSKRVRALVDLAPPLTIVGAVIGSIYLGWATPTESAAIGVVLALMLSIANRRCSFAMLHSAFISMVGVVGMIFLILSAAFFLNFVLSLLGIPQMISNSIVSWGLGPLMVVAATVILCLVLGCVLDAVAMMIAIVPVLVPVLVMQGFDPVWFGVVMMILMELALITPPIGLNLYVVQGVRGTGSIRDVVVGVSPFIVGMLGLIVLLTFFPALALWLPGAIR